MVYLAHKDVTDNREQSVLDHLKGTSELASDFANAFGASDEGYRCGMLHDIGKYSDAFQRRINGSEEHVDHSSAGAYEAAVLCDVPAAFCVAGHHGGLPNGGSKADSMDEPTLHGRLNRVKNNQIEDYCAFKKEVNIPSATILPQYLETQESGLFYIRMLFSCLVDADYLDTERFMKNGAVKRGNFPELKFYYAKLFSYIKGLLDHPDNTLDKNRCKILEDAVLAASGKTGIYTFTAPTGSGKTISSMAFALSHAKTNHLRRVIYIIPYCSIIDQTQVVFERIFGDGCIIAHYSEVEYKTEENKVNGEIDKRYLAAENWDAPVIITTTVQFFESLFSNKPSHCRKLHNIAESVLIFDEAQMLPVSYLRPCIAVISELIKNYRCSAVLCTATQPSLDKLFSESLPEMSSVELCLNVKKTYEQFRRVRYEYIGKTSSQELAVQVGNLDQVLCIVNRRDQAQKIYNLLPEAERFHLSTAMCSADRREKLMLIRNRLQEGKTCRVISTSLIEAGVDVNFPVVYRELAGLDSIIQAGGRCNREGEPGVINGTVYIFESEVPAPRMLAQNIAATKYVLNRFDDISSTESVQSYFSELFYIEKGIEALDEKEILRLCRERSMPFAEISNKFHMIENAQYTVYISREENKSLLFDLEHFGATRSRMRELGKYAVGIYPAHYKELSAAGALHEITDNAAILTDESLYSRDTGLCLTLEEGKGMFI